MKKLWLLSLLVFWPWKPLHAIDMDVWLSSNTSTSDSTGTLCGQYIIGGSSLPVKGVIHGVVVSTGAAGSFMQLFNSSWTVVSTTSTLTIGPINTQAVVSPFYYDTVFNQGLCYTKTGTATVQILYQCYQ
jgi:hypothetical protein